jgi:hypothetical protein
MIFMARTLRGSIAAAAVLLSTSAGAEAAMSEAAETVLRQMSDRLSALASFTADYAIETEYVTTDGQKLQQVAEGTIAVRRGVGLRVTRSGAPTRTAFVYDGATATLSLDDLGLYVRRPVAADPEAAIASLGADTGVHVPAADFLARDPFAALAGSATAGEYVGDAILDGVPCRHLAFREPEVDWQIWIASDGDPLPLRYVITTKWLTAAPQYTLRLRNWKPDAELAAGTFAFTAAAGAREIDHVAIGELDDVLLGGAE